MKKMHITFNLSMSVLKEGNTFVAYTPALDLSTAGKTLEDAQKNFVEAVTLFFEELHEMGTTDQVLSDLGWEKENNMYSPPVVVAHHTESFSNPLAS